MQVLYAGPFLLAVAVALSGCGSTEPAETAEQSASQSAPAQSPSQDAPTESEAPILPAMNGVVAEGEVVFAGQPTAEELRQLQAAGYRVLDLRRPAEERGFDQVALATEIGLAYENVAVDRAALEDEAVHQAFRRAINASEQGPLLVHCASGNRVAGLYYAMLVEERGMERGEALARAEQLGMTSPGVKAGIEAYLDR